MPWFFEFDAFAFYHQGGHARFGASGVSLTPGPMCSLVCPDRNSGAVFTAHPTFADDHAEELC